MRNAAQKARVDVLLAEGRYRDAVPLLAEIIADEPDCAPAYTKLGVAHLRLHQPREAERAFLQAVRLRPDDANDFDGLAETYGNLGEDDKAREAGRRALQLKDAGVTTDPGPLPPLQPRPEGAGVIAFSLFGDRPRYCETAVLNVRAAARVLPGWVCRFYVDATVPPPVLGRLQDSGAQIVAIEPARADLPSTMWRFLALDDPTAAAIICRDADSLLNARDAAFVGAWRDSGRPIHVIRDYQSHSELMLAGLFGVRGGLFADIEGTMRRWLASKGPTHRWTDQHFLRACLWPWARDHALTHDTWFRFGRHIVPDVPRARDAHDHVGANHGSASLAIAVHAPDGTPLQWTLSDAQGAVVCGYTGTIRDKRHVVDIPRSYRGPIERGEWTVRWSVASAPPLRPGVTQV